MTDAAHSSASTRRRWWTWGIALATLILAAVVAWFGVKQFAFGADPNGHKQTAVPVVDALQGVSEFRVLDAPPSEGGIEVVVDVKIEPAIPEEHLVANFNTLSPERLTDAGVDTAAVAFCVYDENDELQTFWNVTDACDFERDSTPWRPAWLAAL